MVAVVCSLGPVASASGVLSLRFASVTVIADGINPTPVQVLVQVVNTGSATTVSAVDARMTWTASGAAVTDLIFPATPLATVSGAGFLFNGTDPNFQITSGSNPQIPWGINASGEPTIATGTTNVALMNLRIAAGSTNAQFTVNFVTGSGAATSFTGGDPDYSTIPYTNGNNGTTFGLITVVPEPSTGTALGTATLLMAGVGFVQQRMRRKSRTAELVG